MVKLHPEKAFQNFYWLGGLHPTSRDTKITVIQHGQTQQCANCLLTEEEGCPAMGIGKNCREMGTPRKPLAEYFQRLEEEDGYISLRTQMKRYRAQERGQSDDTNDAQDNREDVDYFAEMEGLNKSGSNSPLKGAYTNVMNPPTAPVDDTQTKKVQTPKTSTTTTKDPMPNNKDTDKKTTEIP